MYQRNVLLTAFGHSTATILQVLNALHEKGYRMELVQVLHFDKPEDFDYQQTLSALTTAFTCFASQDDLRSVVWRMVPLMRRNGQPVQVIENDEDTDEVLRCLRNLVVNLKREGYHIHWVLSGGDRMVALLAASLAMVQFDRSDHLWDIYASLSPEEEPTRGETHMSLIEIPLLGLGKLMNVSSASLARDAEREKLHNENDVRCMHVYQHCTPRQKQVLEAFARGATPAQVASQLSIGVYAVISHEQAVFALCRQAWNISKEKTMSYSFLRLKFASFFR